MRSHLVRELQVNYYKNPMVTIVRALVWSKFSLNEHINFLSRPYEFDNVVFGINEKEATVMDPQQRMALEMSYKALENAGVPAEKIKGSNTAVYMCEFLF